MWRRSNTQPNKSLGWWRLTLILCVFVQLSNSVDRYINNFQIVDNLSDRGSLIIHLFKVKPCRQQADLPILHRGGLFYTDNSVDLASRNSRSYFGSITLNYPPPVLLSGVSQSARDSDLQASAELQSRPPPAVLSHRLRVLQPRSESTSWTSYYSFN